MILRLLRTGYCSRPTNSDTILQRTIDLPAEIFIAPLFHVLKDRNEALHRQNLATAVRGALGHHRGYVRLHV